MRDSVRDEEEARRNSTVTLLRSPVIDLTGVAAAELLFAEALDLEAGDTLLLAEPVVVAAVALVGGDQVGVAVDLEAGHAVGLVHAEDGPVTDVDGIVLVAGIEAIAVD